MKKQITRRQFLETTMAITGLATAGCVTHVPMATMMPGESASTACLKISNPSKITILQLTDVHFFWGRNEPWATLNTRTEEDLKKLVAVAKPDMLVVTGDLWRNKPPELREEYMRYGIEQCTSLGVPWAFVWGNHDELNDYHVGHKALTEAKNSLYRGSNSTGNYVVDIVDRHHKLVCQLICLNSEREGLGAAQQKWMQELAEKSGKPSVLRLAFFHIPIKQYTDVWNSGVATGFKAEEPCIEKEDGSTLPFLKALGVKACFCGHDHVNDYSGVIDGIELVYGRVTGRGGYSTTDLPPGAKLITVNGKSGQYRWESILPDGTRWTPKPNERIIKERKK